MANVGAAIIARLEGSAAWLGAVGTRTDWGVSQEGTPSPRVVATWITRDRPDHYTGEDLCYSRLQIDVYSETSANEAGDIAEIAIAILRPEEIIGGVRFERAVEIDGPADGGEQTETLYLHRARTDFAFLHANERAE